jgi:TPR repeat protein
VSWKSAWRSFPRSKEQFFFALIVKVLNYNFFEEAMKSWASVLVLLILASGLTSCGTPENREQKFASLEKRAGRGDVSAWFSLGLMHEQGFGVAPNKSQAAFCYRQAAEKGQIQAQYRLGYLYCHGQGVPQDLAQAAEWYQKAAKQGHTPAQAALGKMYLWGEGLPRDMAKAAYWQEKSLKLKNRAKLAWE